MSSSRGRVGLIEMSYQKGHGKFDTVCNMWMEINDNAKQNSKRDNMEPQEKNTNWKVNSTIKHHGKKNILKRKVYYQMSWKKIIGPGLPKVNLCNSHTREI